MKDSQTLFDITINILDRIRGVLQEVKPDIVLVHGDTTTTFASALACFYEKIAVGHIEAGLRIYDLENPFPEEFNRQVVSKVAKLNFAPTEQAKENLLREGINLENIYITGNTAIDALKTSIYDGYEQEELEWAKDSRLILVTAHRRESLGKPIENVFKAIKRVVDEYNDIKVIYPQYI